MWDPTAYSGTILDKSRYVFGFIQLQDMIDTALLEHNGIQPKHVYIQELPQTCTVHDWLQNTQNYQHDRVPLQVR